MVVSVVDSRSFPEATTLFEVDCEKNPSDLFKLIDKRQWEDAVALCNDFPEEARKWGVRRGIDRTVDWRRLPIHDACVGRPNEEVIDALLKAFPRSVRAKDHSGRLPLHHAVFYGASKEIVRKLILAYPEGLHVKDEWRKTPLATAMSSSSKIKGDVVKDLEKGTSYWIVKIEEEKWMREREAKIASLKGVFQQERDAYESRIQDMDRQAEVERMHLKEKIKTLENQVSGLEKQVVSLDVLRSERDQEISRLIEERDEEMQKNKDTVEDLQDKVEKAMEKVVDGSMTKLELERKLAYSTTRVEALEETERGTKVELASMSKSLTEEQIKVCSLEEELQAAKKELSAVGDMLQVTSTSEQCLSDRVQELSSKWEETVEQTASQTIQTLEEKARLEAELGLLRYEVGELTAAKAKLEARTEADSQTISTIGKSSAEYFLTSSGRITELEKTVEALTQQTKQQAEDFEVERSSLEARNQQLEEKVKSKMQLVSKSMSSYQDMESTMQQLSNEHARLRETMATQKKVMEFACADDYIGQWEEERKRTDEPANASENTHGSEGYNYDSEGR